MRSLPLMFLFCFISALPSKAQMQNFSVTDAHGQRHRLYEDYLNQGKVVVLKLFFTTCPPCIANAPAWQQKYTQWGSGSQGVEFFSVTTILSDYDPNVLAFEATYNQTMKAISQDGGAQTIVNPFKNGAYGTYWGTPSFAVIAPDRSIVYGIAFTQLDGAITTAKTKVPPLPTVVDLKITTYGVDSPDDHIKYYIGPKDGSIDKIEIKKDTNGNYKFEYPSAEIPSMNEPEITMESQGPIITNKVTASDLVTIQKHILGLTPFDVDYKKVAADVNGDNKISASDLITIRKAILGLIDKFPNDVPSYKSIPAKISLTPSIGNVITPEFIIVKTGNVN